jgi:nucleoside-diphosphate-sugar epimerase
VVENGQNGELYLAAGQEKKTLNEFCKLVQEKLGLEQKLTHIPSFVGVIFGKILGIKLLTLDNIRHLGKERNYNIFKLKKLGYVEKYNLKKAIKEIVKEFKKQ